LKLPRLAAGEKDSIRTADTAKFRLPTHLSTHQERPSTFQERIIGTSGTTGSIYRERIRVTSGTLWTTFLNNDSSLALSGDA
jgi:hypothetical protein